MFDTYLLLKDFPKPGLIPNQTPDFAINVLDRYADETVREKEGVLRCWITMAGGETPILGRAPKGWSRKDPVYKNC